MMLIATQRIFIWLNVFLLVLEKLHYFIELVLKLIQFTYFGGLVICHQALWKVHCLLLLDFRSTVQY